MHPICNELPYKTFIDSKTSKDTRTNYAADLGILREWMRSKNYGEEVNEVTKTQLLEYVMEMRTRGVADTSIKRYLTAISSFFNYLRSDELSPHYSKFDPREFFKGLGLKQKRTKRRALDQAQRKKVLDSLIWGDSFREWQVSMAIFIAFKTGLRRFEIAKLAWKDIDLEKNKLKVLGKGNKDAVLNITPELHEKLSDYQLLISKVDTPWVFFNRKHPSEHIHKTNIARCFRVIRKRCKFPADVLFSTHDGRRIFCTTLSEKGVKPEVAVKMTRHESIDMYNRYVRVDDDEVKDELNKAIG